MVEHYRPAWVEVDLGALRANARVLAELCAPAALCAVVKADAYGHGAVAAARALLEGGASALAVALVEEGVALREAGIDAPILLLSEPPEAAMAAAAAARLTVTLYRPEGVLAARRGARAARARLSVHVKVDTGMHRVGADPEDLLAVAAAVAAAPELELDGLWSHLAVADDPGDPFTGEQLARFARARARLAGAGLAPRLAHIANSAGAIAHPATRLDWVRCGLACYGELPAPALAAPLAAQLRPGEALTPVLSLKARVHLVRELEAGERTSYGRAYLLEERSRVAVVPIGYHDGVPRALFAAGGEVLVGNRRCRIAGAVTMDQLLVDCGPGTTVAPGDEVVLIGRQGDEAIRAHEWARWLGTIPYEVLCGIGPRVPRQCVPGDTPAATSTQR